LQVEEFNDERANDGLKQLDSAMRILLNEAAA
jgi:hypothetical protein